MKSLRRILACIIIVVLLVAAFHTVSAATENRVYGASVSFSSQDGKVMISIPVNIENNSGFMGFAITVTYDAEVFKPIGAQRGSLLRGMFDNSIGYNEAGSFRVVYSDSAECSRDGELFKLTFEDISSSSEGRTAMIGLSYSKQDTFNEQWQDVTLNCESIRIPLGEQSSVPVSEPETEPTSEPEESTTRPVIDPQPEKKLSERLAEWYASRSVVIRMLLWIIIKPLIRIIAATE
ncbi:MAG: hypothetical protein IKW76_11040 [Clostridia bacterium]|nr:hypothetical protein [Clostridia bacterium]